MREPPDRVAYFRRMAEEPFKLDFFQVLRRMECFYADKPRLGTGMRPADEPIRLAQEPALDFAPATLSQFTPAEGARRPRLAQRFFGLLGPNGPLPLHLTEHARERVIHAGDETFARFLDVLHHRFLLMFYRAWAQAQPTVNLDRPRDDRFALYIGSLIGAANDTVRKRDSIDDYAKLHFAGRLGRLTRNRDGLAALLAAYFKVPTQVEEFVGHWMRLPQAERTQLGRCEEGYQLGVGAVIGGRVWDRQHKVRVVIGAMSLAQYENFLPGGKAALRLTHWVRQYLGLDLDWDARFVLARNDVPRARLGRYGKLGWTTWAGARAVKGKEEKLDTRSDPDKLLLNARRLLRRAPCL